MTEFENKLASTPITMDCFEMDDFFNMGIMDYEDITHEDCWNNLLQALEELRNKYNKTKDKRYWKELIRLLPNSYKCFNQLEKEKEKENAELKKDLQTAIDVNKKWLQRDTELESQIEKMKCCGNCKHIIDISAKFKYCRIQPDKIFNNNICDKWELAE